MKVILSRKGFGSGSGGFASFILPDGTVQSLPIPSSGDPLSYSDITSRYRNKNLLELMRDIKGEIKEREWKELNESTKSHLDPHIDFYALERSEDWKGCFGQIGAAQTVLKNASVNSNDLFLFFWMV